ncbi:MAG: lysylphosphatidylglycerol synthase transmembrane domain-containing protein [Acidobacteriota bacterium]
MADRLDSIDGVPPEGRGSRGIRRRFMLFGKVVVSVGLLALLLSRTDVARLWTHARTAAPAWLAGALLLYFTMILVSAWRWRLLLGAQGVAVPGGHLVNSYLVATFFNNFLPSNIGGDVVRITDTAPQAGSKTLAVTIVLMDRAIGLLGLGLVAAIGASVASANGTRSPIWAPALWLGLLGGLAVALPLVLAPTSVGRLLRPFGAFNRGWADERVRRFTGGLWQFRRAPLALSACFAGAVAVQGILVAFYAAVAHSMHIPVTLSHLAVLVPVSFIVQMAPVSLNGFGVREATFSFYFSQIGLPIESALAVSFMGAALIMLFSLSGAAAFWMRGPAVAATLSREGLAD